MIHTEHEFQQRMRCDRAFRHRIMAARKNGILAEVLAQEGYEIDLNMLVIHIPQVRTNIHGGQCYCLMSPDREEGR